MILGVVVGCVLSFAAAPILKSVVGVIEKKSGYALR